MTNKASCDIGQTSGRGIPVFRGLRCTCGGTRREEVRGGGKELKERGREGDKERGR